MLHADWLFTNNVCLDEGLSLPIPHLSMVGTVMLTQALGFGLKYLVRYQLHFRREAVSWGSLELFCLPGLPSYDSWRSGTTLMSLCWVERTQWKQCSVCLLSSCSWKVLTWHLKLQSSIYTLEKCPEILHHVFSIPISLFPNSHLRISAFSHKPCFIPFCRTRPTF